VTLIAGKVTPQQTNNSTRGVPFWKQPVFQLVLGFRDVSDADGAKRIWVNPEDLGKQLAVVGTRWIVVETGFNSVDGEGFLASLGVGGGGSI
jgi:hypothetical protein